MGLGTGGVPHFSVELHLLPGPGLSTAGSRGGWAVPAAAALAADPAFLMG